MSRENNVCRVALDSLGCKLNKAEVELLARQLVEAGYRVVPPAGETDVYVLNTCTVTHVADRKSRHCLRQAHRRNPRARLVVTGCYAQRAPQELAWIEGVELVLDNGQKPRLPRLLAEAGFLGLPQGKTDEGYHGIRTRALVKVQDGCDNACSFCIVPRVRGRGQSRPVRKVVDEVRQLLADGYKEIVLTGTEIGSYRDNGTSLTGLLELVMGETDVPRLRLSSLQPPEISPELIGLWRDERLCRHFHLSLQSGSDSVLQRMNRHYSSGDYQRSVSLIRSALPEAAFTTDVIVGFPGETGDEFQESYEFCRRLGFARIHVFIYSPRTGTLASRMLGQVADGVKKQRSRRMLALSGESGRSFKRRFLGSTMPVLWEKQVAGVWHGLTDNYIRVYTKCGKDLTNELLPMKLVKIYKDGVWGEV